jgi:hypothetical protein
MRFSTDPCIASWGCNAEVIHRTLRVFQNLRIFGLSRAKENPPISFLERRKTFAIGYTQLIHILTPATALGTFSSTYFAQKAVSTPFLGE